MVTGWGDMVMGSGNGFTLLVERNGMAVFLVDGGMGEFFVLGKLFSRGSGNGSLNCCEVWDFRDRVLLRWEWRSVFRLFNNTSELPRESNLARTLFLY